jgi:hypothetical protein
VRSSSDSRFLVPDLVADIANCLKFVKRGFVNCGDIEPCLRARGETFVITNMNEYFNVYRFKYAFLSGFFLEVFFVFVNKNNNILKEPSKFICL